MRLLQDVTLTRDQLPLLGDTRDGVMLIKGAAGSGKTTTALMRLRQLCQVWLSRRDRLGIAEPVRVLVLTFNKTLEGYIAALAADQIAGNAALELEVSTFARWAKHLVGGSFTLEPDNSELLLRGLCRQFGGDLDFILEEVDYVLSRFEPADLEEYLTVERKGRGVAPRVDSALRRRLLDEVIYPYSQSKLELGWRDWNDLAIAAKTAIGVPWDVVVIDETQDFSANQLRAVMSHVADHHQVTFVMDAAQQIYPRYFTWSEADASPDTIHTLKSNYRNTREIAAFARPLVEGLPLDVNGALPDFTSATRGGNKPHVLSGLYSRQLEWAVANVVVPAVAAGQSVAFLKPRGGHWFDAVKTRLDQESIPWVGLTRQSDWPDGAEQVAVCTLHSAKGLEFDHVIIIGLNQNVTPHGGEPGDSQLEALRRLVAMGVGRARLSVTVGSKPSEASSLLTFLDPNTFTRVNV